MSYRSCTAPKEGLLFATHFSIREKGELHSGQEQDHTKDIYSVRGGELGSFHAKGSVTLLLQLRRKSHVHAPTSRVSRGEGVCGLVSLQP